MTQRFALPVGLLGSRARGRSYQLLAASAGFKPSTEAAARLNDLALSLSAWAERRRGSFAALVPLDSAGAAGLLRGVYVGEGELGPVAAASCVLLDAAMLDALGGHAHRLLPLLDAPDLASGPKPLDVELRGLRRSPARADVGLAWSDLVVAAEPREAEAVLLGLLEGVSPPEQLLRITAWATTASLTRKGGFSPAAFQLVVYEPGDDDALEETGGRRIAAGFLGPPPAAPPAWSAWESFKRLPVRDQTVQAAVDALDWAPALAGFSPEQTVERLVLAACGALTIAEASMLIAEAAASPAPGFEAGALAAAAVLIAAQQTAPNTAAVMSKLLLATPELDRLRLAPLLPLIARTEVLGGFEGAAADSLLRLGLADVLLAHRQAPAPDAALFEPLMDEAIDRGHAGDDDWREYVSRMIVIAAQAGRSDLAVHGLTALKDAEPSRQDYRLATPAVAAVARHARLTAMLSARSVRPALGAATTPGGFLRAAEAALELLDEGLEAA